MTYRILGIDVDVTTGHLSLGWGHADADCPSTGNLRPRDTTLDLHWGTPSPAHLRYSALHSDEESWTTIHWVSSRYSREDIFTYFDLEGYDGGAGRPFAWDATIKRGYWLCKATQRGGLDI